MQQQTITLTDPDLPGEVRVTVARADVRHDIMRSRLENDARVSGEADPELRTVLTDVLPTLVAGTLSAEGVPWPLTADDLLALPLDVALAWRAAIWELNPAWRPRPLLPPDEKKSGPTPSTSG